MSDKSPSRGPAAPAQAPAPPSVGPAGLEDQNLLGNAGVMGQLGAGVGGGAGGAPTPTLASVAQPAAGAAGPEEGPRETQENRLLGIHMRETKQGGRYRVVVSFDDDDEGGTMSVDYIEGLYFAQVNDGSKRLQYRGDARRLVVERIEKVGGRLEKMASTGRVTLTADQQAGVRAKIAEIKGKLGGYYDAKVEDMKMSGRRDSWEQSLYDGAEIKDASASRENPSGGRNTSVQGEDDVATSTTHPEPPGSGPTPEPPAEKPHATPATPEAKEPAALEPPLPDPVRILFDRDKAQADPKALSGLQSWCNTEHEFAVTAYASAEGRASYNLALSQRRADWVKGVLSGMGAAHVEARGRGEEDQGLLEAAESGRPAGDKEQMRQKWRRAEVTVRRRPTPTPRPGPNPAP